MLFIFFFIEKGTQKLFFVLNKKWKYISILMLSKMNVMQNIFVSSDKNIQFFDDHVKTEKTKNYE